MHYFIFYGSYSVFSFLLVLIVYAYKYKNHIFKSELLSVLTVLLFLLSLTFIYARFIERNSIVTKTTQISTGFNAKFVVISDMHLGVYKSTSFLKRVVDKINTIKSVDAVLIPGDFTYYPSQDLEKLFAPLKNLKFPAYAVLGNHDSEKPGPPIREKLKTALQKNGVVFLHNSSAILKSKNIVILGLGDNYTKEDDVSQIAKYTKSDNLVVLTHNPDTTLKYNRDAGTDKADLTISGHTHGGQIRIPFIYKRFIPSHYGFDRGLYFLSPQTLKDNKNKMIFSKGYSGKVFVTSGIGEIGLPMRFGIPPTIDILELK